MAFPDNRSGNRGYQQGDRPSYQGGNRNYSQGNRPPYQGGNNQPVNPPKAETIPHDYVQAAETIFANAKLQITSSKLRNFFSQIIPLYNTVCRNRETPLTSDQMATLTSTRIRMIYEAGRDNNVKDFLVQSKLINYLMSIGDSSEEFLRYYHYFEALIAYHRFYGGK